MAIGLAAAMVRDMSRAFYIHAGAHRTGTSSLQMCLHDNRDVLEGAGFDLAFPGRDGVPSGTLALRLPRPRHGKPMMDEFRTKARAQINALTRDPAHSMILSEENIPGPMKHFYQGRFFPGAGKRCRVLRHAMADGHVDTLLFVVRDYAGLFVSSWRKRAEDNPMEPFKETVPAYMNMDRGWPELVLTLQQELQPKRFVLVEHSSRKPRAELLNLLCPQTKAMALTEPAGNLNVSATDAGLNALQSRFQSGETLDRAEWQSVIAKHADDTRDLGLTGFNSKDHSALNARYAADLYRLRDMPGIEFIV
ncbi:MAG: hypothetical protein ABJ246_20255 [Paracoccaceae bacterium]